MSASYPRVDPSEYQHDCSEHQCDATNTTIHRLQRTVVFQHGELEVAKYNREFYEELEKILARKCRKLALYDTTAQSLVAERNEYAQMASQTKAQMVEMQVKTNAQVLRIRAKTDAQITDMRAKNQDYESHISELKERLSRLRELDVEGSEVFIERAAMLSSALHVRERLHNYQIEQIKIEHEEEIMNLKEELRIGNGGLPVEKVEKEGMVETSENR